MIFASLCLVIVLFDRATVKDNTRVHDGLRRDEQGTAAAILDLAKSVRDLTEAIKHEQRATKTGP